MQKQSIGIDISKDSFTACFCLLHQGGHLQFSDVKKFKNDKSGFN